MRFQLAQCRSNFRLMSAVCGLALLFAVPAGVCAQTEHISHRRLKLPADGSSDALRQMQLLRQLQALVTGKQDESLPPEPSSISPNQIEALGELMKSFGGQIPPELQPDLADIPPGVLSRIMSDPGAQQQVREMLQRYAQNRRIPAGGRQSGPPLLPPGNRGSADTTSAGNDGPDNGEKAQPSDKTSSADNSDEQSLPSMSDLLQKLKKFQEQYAPEGQSPTGPTDSEPRTGDGKDSALSEATRPTGKNQTGSASTERTPQSDEEWAEVLESLINKQRGNPDVRDNGDRDESPIRFPGQGLSGASPPGDGTNQSGTRSASDQGQQASASGASGGKIPSVSEFLKEFRDVPLDTMNNNQAASDSLSKQRSDASGRVPGDSAPAAADSSASASEVLKKQQQIKSELSKNGFQQTLRRIAREAQREAKAAGATQTAGDRQGMGSWLGASGTKMEGSLLRALDGIREDLVDIAKDAKFRPDGSSREAGSNAWRRSPTPPRSPSGSGGLGKAAVEFFSDLAAAPITSAAAPSGVSPTGMVDGSAGMLTTLGLLSLLAGGAFAAWKFGIIHHSNAALDGTHGLTATQIRSKADVVRAFHQLALNPKCGAEPWWTHQMVAGDLAAQSPEHNSSVNLLAALYEQARYLSDDHQFTEEQIQAAREAVRQCAR